MVIPWVDIVIGMRNPNKFVSVSAFSPISNPSDCPWGEKALGRYLGDDKAAWQDYDASLLLGSKTHSVPMLVEQGTKDEFLHEQLKPQSLVHAAVDTNEGIIVTFLLHHLFMTFRLKET